MQSADYLCRSSCPHALETHSLQDHGLRPRVLTQSHRSCAPTLNRHSVRAWTSPSFPNPSRAESLCIPCDSLNVKCPSRLLSEHLVPSWWPVWRSYETIRRWVQWEEVGPWMSEPGDGQSCPTSCALHFLIQQDVLSQPQVPTTVMSLPR